MKKSLIAIGLSIFVLTSPIVADALKSSLTNLLNEEDSTGMVNLDGISINGKAKPQASHNNFVKSRSPDTIIATVKGSEIRKKEADAFLKKVTKGKVNDFDRLPEEQQKVLIQELAKEHTFKNVKSRQDTAIVATVNGIDITKKEADNFLNAVSAGRAKDFDRLDIKQREVLINDLARPIVIGDVADANLTDKEKDAALKQLWLRKQRANIEVTNEETLALYEAKKTKALATNSNVEIPAYISLGDALKNEIFEKKVMGKLMKDVKIEVNYDTNTSDKIQNTKETE